MKPFFSGSALLVFTLLSTFIVFSAKPSLGETLLTKFQKPSVSPQSEQSSEIKRIDEVEADVAKANAVDSSDAKPLTATDVAVINPDAGLHYIATAYSLRGRTASGRYVSQGVIAADPRVLPLGSRVRLEAGPWSGEYLVADTGGAIKGRKIDIWTPSSREAMRFGRRKVKLTVLSYPPKRASRKRV
jgi:3D (Asp-Asp-Asp) domain-containing protein